MGCIRALRGAKDSISDFEFRRFLRSGAGGCRQDGTREFHAGDPWERWLVLVFALDLEYVEEIRAGGVDFNKVFVCCWLGGGQVCYFQVEGALFFWSLSVDSSLDRLCHGDENVL